MRTHTAAAWVEPRWLAAVWTWLPAAAGLLVFGVAAVLQLHAGAEVSWWVPAGLACAGAYGLRERWPVAALAVCLLVVAAARLPGAGVLNSDFDVVYLLLVFVPVLPLVAVASHLTPRWSSLALAATALVTVAVAPDPVWSTTTYSAQAALAGYVLNLGVPLAVAVAAWLAGCATRARQLYAEALLERAASLDQARHAEAARAVAEERARIAQELHDVVTHTVAVMVVQASAADAIWDRDPQQARTSLRAVEESGRTAMADLRGMLGAMRAEDSSGERQAPAGVDQLSALVDQVRTTGLSACLTVAGQAHELAPAISLSLLRIAQESVTNALRHAHASKIAIELVVDDEKVRLSVIDDGIGYDETRLSPDTLDPLRLGGHGLVGMRERAKVIGGTLDVDPGADGGTVVTVRAPRRQDGLA